MVRIGDGIRLPEDEHLVTGLGHFAGDLRLPGQLHAAFRRSDLPHARIGNVDVSKAQAMPGVVAVFTVRDLPDTARFLVERQLPPHLAAIARPVLAATHVKHVGEAIACVIAQDPYVAADAAADVEVSLEPLQAAGTLGVAIAPGAALVHPGLGMNVGWWGTDGFGDVGAAFADAPITVSDRLEAARVCGAAIEPRAAAATPDREGLIVWASTQAIFRVREMIAGGLGLDPERIVVRADDVGGGFGPKSRRYPEDLLVAWAAYTLGRPVRWVGTRSEEMAAAMQAHGSIFDLELAADRDGKLRGLRGVLWHDIGAYPSIGALIPSSIVRNMLCTYRLPAFALEVRDVFTNTVSTATVRGGGGPEGNFAVERMLDRLAAELGIAPHEIRRRNLISADQMPYRVRLSATTITVESGDFHRLLDEALAAMPQLSAPGGRVRRGMGVAMGVESNIAVFEAEPARIRVGADGHMEVLIGSSPQGQSHLTLAAQVASAKLGWPLDRITARAGDTSLLPRAGPTASSRSAVHITNVVALAAATVRSRFLELAAMELGVPLADLELAPAMKVVNTRTGQRVDAFALLPPEGLDVLERWRTTTGGTNPSSCHCVEVAVDPESGAVEVVRYVIAYDAGVVVNPLVVEGQVAGGVLHGVGYALVEDADYAPDGSLGVATFRDYAVLGGRDAAFQLVLQSRPTRATTNPEGIKGAGEVGTIAAPAAIAAAIEAALPGVRVRRMPVRPEDLLL